MRAGSAFGGGSTEAATCQQCGNAGLPVDPGLGEYRLQVGSHGARPDTEFPAARGNRATLGEMERDACFGRCQAIFLDDPGGSFVVALTPPRKARDIGQPKVMPSRLASRAPGSACFPAVYFPDIDRRYQRGCSRRARRSALRRGPRRLRRVRPDRCCQRSRYWRVIFLATLPRAALNKVARGELKRLLSLHA